MAGGPGMATLQDDVRTGPWETDPNGRSYRLIEINGVRSYEWYNENGPTTPYTQQSILSQDQSIPRSNPASQSLQSRYPDLYYPSNTAPSTTQQGPRIRDPWGYGQQPQTPATGHQSLQRAPAHQDLTSSSYGLFPSQPGANPRASLANSPPESTSPDFMLSSGGQAYRDSDGNIIQVAQSGERRRSATTSAQRTRSTVYRDEYGNDVHIANSGERRRSATTTAQKIQPQDISPDSVAQKKNISGQQTSLGLNFAKIEYNDFAECEKFVKKYPEITDKEAVDALLQEAVRAHKETNSKYVRNCIQKLLILRTYSGLASDGRRAFFRRLISREESTMRKFLKEFDTIYAAIKAQAGPSQSEPEPQNPLALSDQIARLSLSSPDPDRKSERVAPFLRGKPGYLPIIRQGKVASQFSDEQRATDINAPPITPSVISIQGTYGDEEVLDSRYRKRTDAKHFFIFGRVFALLWHENTERKKGATFLSEPKYISETKFGQAVYSHIRRMVVVNEGHGFCWCIPINSYGGRGVSKSGLSNPDIESHTIIHMAGTSPARLATENGLVKEPIAVDMAGADQKLDQMSRLNFGKVHTVEWNVKVMNVGKVSEESMNLLGGYWHKECQYAASRR